MNIKFTALALTAATALALAPKPAVAGDRELAVVGGLIGGLIIGSALADHDDDRVVVTAGYNRYDRYDNHRGRGYWKTVSVNVWVPGYWVVERGYHGRSHRYFVPGRYECRSDRVWVSQDRYDRDDDCDDRYDRRDDGYDREIGRGYGYDRNRRDRDYRR